MFLNIQAQLSEGIQQIIVYEEIEFEGKSMELGCHGAELWFYS